MTSLGNEPRCPYDRGLLLAAQMLDVPAPEPPDKGPLAPEVRAALEDRFGARRVRRVRAFPGHR